MIDVVVFTDGRDRLLMETLDSFDERVSGQIGQRIVVDDTGDLSRARSKFRTKLHDRGYVTIVHGRRLGFGESIRATWEWLTKFSDAEYLVTYEDDFLTNRDVDLDAMVGVLERNPHLAQLVLKRQAWNAEEKAAGGIIEQHPDDYTEREDEHGYSWIEHRRFWSTNPGVFRRSLCAVGWPQTQYSEGVFTHRLLVDPDLRFAFWGRKADPPWVEHIGHERAGSGY